MSYYLPRNLVTTMGVELTFMPQMWERVCIATKGRVKPWNMHSYNDNDGREASRSMLKYLLEAEEQKVCQVKLDPMCVEVPTMPYKSGPALRRAIVNIRRCANIVELTATNSFCVGGGAHIHAGIIGETYQEKDLFVNHMMYFAVCNPWLSHAFAGWNDVENAGPIMASELHAEGKPTVDALKDACESYYNDLQMYKTTYSNIVKRLHTVEVWSNRVARGGMLDRRRMYEGYMIRTRLAYNIACKRVLEFMEHNLSEVVLENTIDITQLQDYKYKNRMMVRRDLSVNGTIEFRAFVMPETNRGHEKHLALVNAICRRAKLNMEAGITQVAPMPEYPPQVRKHKYSEMKAGFHAMLVELGFNPRDFRSETINMARKIRYARKHYK